jgi:hypothetical protein
MLDHCTYDKIKLLQQLSSIVWYIEKHAKSNAKDAQDMRCHDAYEKLAQDMEKHVNVLQKELCKK